MKAMRYLRPAVALSTTLFFSCAPSEDEVLSGEFREGPHGEGQDSGEFDGSGADSGGSEEEPDGFAPIEGDWVKLDEYLPLDECNMGDWVSDGPGGLLVLSRVGTDGLDIAHDHGTETCTFDESGFECRARQTEDTTAEEDYGLDALILLELAASGVFDGRDSLQMQTHIVANCAGDDCWMVELATAEFPCEMEVHLEAEAG